MSKIDQSRAPELFVTIMSTNTSSIYEIDLAFSRINKPCMVLYESNSFVSNDFVSMLIFVLQ